MCREARQLEVIEYNVPHSREGMEQLIDAAAEFGMQLALKVQRLGKPHAEQRKARPVRLTFGTLEETFLLQKCQASQDKGV